MYEANKFLPQCAVFSFTLGAHSATVMGFLYVFLFVSAFKSHVCDTFLFVSSHFSMGGKHPNRS